MDTLTLTKNLVAKFELMESTFSLDSKSFEKVERMTKNIKEFHGMIDLLIDEVNSRDERIKELEEEKRDKRIEELEEKL
ncbi:MAG: hypothetical protein IIA82_03955 [Thaumarchaeota archaeon]|nr:hypothetical protein [Nitrososphaerota archaeon]